jgi:hypothetical protein
VPEANFYDTLGRTYQPRRESDPRIARTINVALAGSGLILNVGARTGSYEPRSELLVAPEPSSTMTAQQPSGAAPSVQARAEALPFRDGNFDAVMAVVPVHMRTADKPSLIVRNDGILLQSVTKMD